MTLTNLNHLVDIREHTWGFTIYLKKRDGGTEDIKSYNPKSDFRLDLQSIFPVIVGEVVSDPIHNSDEYRMLVQVIAILAIGSEIIQGDKGLVLMAIYLDTDNTARRYLMHRRVTESGEVQVSLLFPFDEHLFITDDPFKIDILKDVFDLKDAVHGRRLLLQIYNYVAYIQTFRLKKDGRERLDLLTAAGRKLQSLNSSRKDSRNLRSRQMSKNKTSKEPKLEAVEEETTD